MCVCVKTFLAQMDVSVLSFLFSCQQYDLETIKDMYLEKYDVSLKDALKNECSGDFKRLLLAICHWKSRADVDNRGGDSGVSFKLRALLFSVLQTNTTQSLSVWHYVGIRRVEVLIHFVRVQTYCKSGRLSFLTFSRRHKWPNLQVHFLPLTAHFLIHL